MTLTSTRDRVQRLDDKLCYRYIGVIDLIHNFCLEIAYIVVGSSYEWSDYEMSPIDILHYVSAVNVTIGISTRHNCRGE